MRPSSDGVWVASLGKRRRTRRRVSEALPALNPNAGTDEEALLVQVSPLPQSKTCWTAASRPARPWTNVRGSLVGCSANDPSALPLYFVTLSQSSSRADQRTIDDQAKHIKRLEMELAAQQEKCRRMVSVFDAFAWSLTALCG